jgi:hypothetical protein
MEMLKNLKIAIRIFQTFEQTYFSIFLFLKNTCIDNSSNQCQHNKDTIAQHNHYINTDYQFENEYAHFH